MALRHRRLCARYAPPLLVLLSRRSRATGARHVAAPRARGGDRATLPRRVLFPIVVAAERRFPLDRGRWRGRGRSTRLATSSIRMAHTTMIAGCAPSPSRSLGQGAYDYGRCRLRYFMESPQDFISYAIVRRRYSRSCACNSICAPGGAGRELERDAAQRAPRGSKLAPPAAFSLQRAQHDLVDGRTTILSPRTS